MPYKDDNKLFWRGRISRFIEVRLRAYLVKYPQGIIPLLDKIIGDWLKKRGY